MWSRRLKALRIAAAHRARFLGPLFWRPWARVVGFVYALLGFLDFVRGRLSEPYLAWWDNYYVLPDIGWRTWLIAGLVITLIVVAEGAYRASERRRIVVAWKGPLNQIRAEGRKLNRRLATFDDTRDATEAECLQWVRSTHAYLLQELPEYAEDFMLDPPASIDAMLYSGVLSPWTKKMEWRLERLSEINERLIQRFPLAP